MITVIVPIYNTEKYLRRCLDSITNQTYKNLEIILVDDGSNDNSLSICKEYKLKDDRIKILTQVNKGQGAARNYGLEICNGEYISFIDSDDYIDEYMYEKMLSKIKEYNVDMAICGYYRDYGFFMKKQPVPDKNKVYDNLELIKSYINTPYITSSVCNKLYKKEIWENERFPTIRAREDIGILYKVLANIKSAIHIGECSYIQYVRPGSTERKKFSEDKLTSIKISEKIIEYINNIYPELHKYVFLEKATTCVNLMKEIIYSFSYKKYTREYNMMLNILDEELKKNYRFRELDCLKYDKLKSIKNNQFKFKFLARIFGIREIILDFFINITFKIKEQRKISR